MRGSRPSYGGLTQCSPTRRTTSRRSDSGKYAADAQRTQTIRLLASQFEHKQLLLVAPHNGYPDSFLASLVLLGDQRFAHTVWPERPSASLGECLAR
jgi:hypothetical protein